MKYLSYLVTRITSSACFLVLPFSLMANESNQSTKTSEEQHVNVGERNFSYADHIERVLNTESECEKNCEQENEADEILARKIFCSTHNGAYHHPIAVSNGGDTVTLEDGSVWHVREKDQVKTLDWLMGDTVVILPNHSWFSSYQFVLFNQTTGREVKANLLLGPIFNGVFTHWIVSIDLETKQVWLEDGSVWSMASGDKSTLKKWLVNDTVIIGINDSWFSSKENILINVNMANWAAGECINCL